MAETLSHDYPGERVERRLFNLDSTDPIDNALMAFRDGERSALAPSQQQAGPFISRIQSFHTSRAEKEKRRDLLVEAYMPFVAVTAYFFKNRGCRSQDLLAAGREVVRCAPETYRRRRDFSVEVAFALVQKFTEITPVSSTSPIIMDLQRQDDYHTPLDIILAQARMIRPNASL